jgi:hypothetical protein
MTTFQIICLTVVSTSIIFVVVLHLISKHQEKKHSTYKLPDLSHINLNELERKSINDIPEDRIIHFDDMKYFNVTEFIETVEYEQRAMQEN